MKCGRIGCSEESTHRAGLAIFPDLEGYVGDPILGLMGLEVCEKHATDETVDSLYTENAGGRAMVEQMCAQLGLWKPDHLRSGGFWVPRDVSLESKEVQRVVQRKFRVPE